jgi:hypothetical protein
MKQSLVKEELEKQIQEKKLKKEQEKREQFIRDIQEVERLKRENEELRERYLRELMQKQEANNQVGAVNKQNFDSVPKKGKNRSANVNQSMTSEEIERNAVNSRAGIQEGNNYYKFFFDMPS